MLLVFLLLLPLVTIPFLVEWDNKWFKRFAFCIAGLQMFVALFRYYPESQASVSPLAFHWTENLQLLMKAVFHIF